MSLNSLLQKKNNSSNKTILTPENKNKDLSEDYIPILNSNSILFPFYKTNKGISETMWGSILGDIYTQKDLIDLVDVLNLQYYSPYLSNVENVKDALDTIVDKLYYTFPEKVKVNYYVECFRKGEKINTLYKGMVLDKVNFYWNVINYTNYEKSIKFDGKLNTNNYESFYNISSNITKNLNVSIKYKDSKGNSPQPYNENRFINFLSKLYYYTENSILDKRLITSNIFNISLDSPLYVYIMLTYKNDNIHIYELGSVDPGGIVTSLLDIIQYKEYDENITYYVYKSINLLSGKWSIKI